MDVSAPETFIRIIDDCMQISSIACTETYENTQYNGDECVSECVPPVILHDNNNNDDDKMVAMAVLVVVLCAVRFWLIIMI